MEVEPFLLMVRSTAVFHSDLFFFFFLRCKVATSLLSRVRTSCKVSFYTDVIGVSPEASLRST